MVVLADVYTAVTIREGITQKAPGLPREKVYRFAIDFLKTAEDLNQYDLSWSEVREEKAVSLIPLLRSHFILVSSIPSSLFLPSFPSLSSLIFLCACSMSSAHISFLR